MAFIVRAIGPDEMEPYVKTNSIAFGHHSTLERVAFAAKHYEFDRSTAAFDGDELVGTAGIYSFDMTVPGGSLPTAGVTWVGALPTHRRRGMLAAMMRHQLDGIRDRGEAIATLWASESPIYSRFGYGNAAEGVEMRIERVRTKIRHQAPAPGRTRMVERETAIEKWPALYEKVRLQHAGMFSKPDWWWADRNIRPIEDWPAGVLEQFLVQYEEDGAVHGYVRYSISESRVDGYSTSTLEVHEHLADGPAAYGALWEYLFGVDLIGTIHAMWRRVDEPLLHMLEDSRRLVRRTQDTLWARIMDVPRAMEGRRYRADGRLIFRIEDSFCDWNSGTYRLEVDGGCGRCVATSEEPEIEMSIVELGALYYGGGSLAALVQAGRATGDAAAVARADLLLGWGVAPWCPEIF